MKLRVRCYYLLSIIILFMLSGCLFTSDKHVEFNPEKAAIARLKLGLGYLDQAQNTSDKSSEKIKLAHYNLMLANQYSPQNTNVMLGMALFDQHVGEHQEAEAIYKTILDLEPYNDLYRIHYASFLCATDRYLEAKEQYDKVLELNHAGWKSDTLEQLGYCAIQNGDKEQSDKAFKSLFKYDETKRQEVAETAAIYQQKGDIFIADYLRTISQ